MARCPDQNAPSTARGSQGPGRRVADLRFGGGLGSTRGASRRLALRRSRCGRRLRGGSSLRSSLADATRASARAPLRRREKPTAANDAVSSHELEQQEFNIGGSNPRANVYPKLNMPFGSFKLAGAGPVFPPG